MIGSDRTWHYREALQKRNKQLYEEMLQPGALKPRLTISKLMAFAVALLIHSITLYFVWAFLWNLANAFVGIQTHSEARIGASIIAAGVSLIAAWLLRPHLGRWPDTVLDSAKFPALYDLANKVAEELHTRPVEGIQINHNFNASYGRIGLKQRPLITIGLPLWAALTDQERVALIAHEVAHGANGDATRGLVLGSAYNSAISWHNFAVTLIRPGYRGPSLNFFLLPIWIIASIFMSILRRLLHHESRRAEYLADKLAADIGGKQAVSSLLTKLQFTKNYDSYFKNAADGILITAIYELFQKHMAAIQASPKEMQNLEREKAISDAHYNFTHPPTALRLAFLENLPQVQPSLTLSSDESVQLTREFYVLTKGLRISRQ